MDPEKKLIYSIIEGFIKDDRSIKEARGSLTKALGIREREVVSLTGAGGKTTLMFRLAHDLLDEGKRIVTTTTTKILEPTPSESPYIFLDSSEEKIKGFVYSCINQYRHITIAQEKLGSGKLRGISKEAIDDLWSLSIIDHIIIEADGSARRPIKAPREGEPVIPSNTTLVVGILGLDGLGRELNDENVFQAERVSQITGISMGERITEEAMAILFTHPEGIFKGAPSSARLIAFINKLDILNGMSSGSNVAERILHRRHPKIERIVLGQVNLNPPVLRVVFS